MHRMNKYLGSLLLGIGLIAPMGIQAANNFRDDGYQGRRLQGLPSMGSPRRRQVPALGIGKARGLSALLPTGSRATESILAVSSRTS